MARSCNLSNAVRVRSFAGRRSLPRLAALLLATGAGGLQAQTLREVYEAARAHDAVYLAARAQAEAAPFRAAQAEALKRPSAALDSSLTANNFETGAGATRSGVNAGVSISARQPIYNPADDATVGQARRQLQGAAHELEIAEQELILRVAQAYFDVLAAQDAIGTARASKAAISEQLASARRNFEVGTATITDTREAQARFDLASAQEIQAVNDLQTRRVALDQLVGREGVEPRPLAMPVVLQALTPASMNDWVGRADAEHPNIRRNQIALEVARLETEKARAGHLPRVDAVGSIGVSHQTGSLTSSTASIGNNRNASVGVQIALPLFSGYAVQNRVKETTVLQVKARNDLEAARRGAIQATRQAYLAVESGLAQVRALEAAERSSQLALEATQLGYRVGVRVNLDVLNAQTQLFTTRRDLARARYDVLLAGLRLRQAAGRVEPGDLSAVSALLAP